MANPEHVEIVKQGAKAIAEWRKEHPDVRLDLLHADLREANLDRAVLRGANMTRAVLRGAWLVETDLREADLPGANLSGADLSRADLTWATLSEAVLRGASLVRAQLGEADLNEADLNEAKVMQANLAGANLTRVVLHRADLTEASLNRAVLGGANLRDANLRDANLTGANLTGANLRGADVSGANMRGADMRGADVSEALFGNTCLADIDLSETKGMEAARWFAPSSIGVDTLLRSRGRIPAVFLRGCGVPDTVTDAFKGLVGRAIEFYSCFISHSSKDAEFARRLHERMQGEGLRVWYAPEDMKGGQRTIDQIDRAIRVYDKFLLVLSEESIASDWVRTEIRLARKREKEQGRRLLFPIRLVSVEVIRAWECFDSDSGRDLAADVREYHIPDFCNWKDHDSFEKGFKALLRDLRKGEEKT